MRLHIRKQYLNKKTRDHFKKIYTLFSTTLKKKGKG